MKKYLDFWAVCTNQIPTIPSEMHANVSIQLFTDYGDYNLNCSHKCQGFHLSLCTGISFVERKSQWFEHNQSTGQEVILQLFCVH